MSLELVKPYFISRIDTCGLKRHKDVFAFDNIPSTILDKSYHILLLEASTENQSGQDIQLLQRLEVRFFLKGFRNVEEAETKARQKASEVISSVCFIGNHTSTIKGVELDSFICEPLAESNDNCVVGILTFTARTHICLI